MKKIILSVMAAAFAVAAHAGSEKAASDMPACCGGASKAECTMGKDGKGCSMGKTARTACTQPVLKSPKALG